MSEEALIAALIELQAVPTHDSLIMAEGLLLGFLSKEGYQKVVHAYLALRQTVHGERLGTRTL